MVDCAFCRTPFPDNDSDRLAMIQARVEKKDAVAIDLLGQKYSFGSMGLKKDARKAAELWTKAAELGSIEALFNLGHVYLNGEGVQQDKAKGIQYFEKAAMQGHVASRHNLGENEVKSGNYDRAVRHFLISAKLGYEDSVENIKEMFKVGLVTKEMYAQALRGYQDAVEEMKSPERDEAKKYYKSIGP